MSSGILADDLLRVVAQLVFVAVFLHVAGRAARYPRPANLDAVLPFAATVLIFLDRWIVEGFGLSGVEGAVETVNAALGLTLPYLLLRLFRHFASVPVWLLRGALAGLAVAAVSVFAVEPRPAWLRLAYVAYIVGLSLYAAIVFFREVPRARGVTGRRMRAIAGGTALLGLASLTIGLRSVLPDSSEWWQLIGRLLALGAGVGFGLGLAPPAWLRRAWQEPELRGFVGRATRLARLADQLGALRELERGAAVALGLPDAIIGVWDAARGTLRYHRHHLPPLNTSRDADSTLRGVPACGSGAWLETPPGQLLGGRAFLSQRPLFSGDAGHDDPAHAELYRRAGVTTVMAAPITSGDRRLGVLVIYSPHTPMFAEDDMDLVALLAEGAAAVLEHRLLVAELAQAQAQAEVLRLKEDFLSSAAHDLNTPLTTVIAEAQVLSRRLARDPAAPANVAGVRRIVAEAGRLRTVIGELLDVAQAGTKPLVGTRDIVNLAAIVDAACQQYNTIRHPCYREGDVEALGLYDPVRLTQLVDHLIDNAVKYSPDGGGVVVRLWREGDEVRLSVTDRGIGIAADDLPGLFERFGRGRNVDDRRFVGMGLGLYLCRMIAEQHGGRLWAASDGPGRGSTFHVALPVLPTLAPLAASTTGGEVV